MSFLTISLLAFTLQSPTIADQEAIFAMELGQRAAKLQHSFSLVNQVVLVPDEATYLDELSKWTPEKRWPVLFDDNRFAPRFIRRFRPKKIWRRESVGSKIESFEQTAQIVIAKACGNTSVSDNQFEPLGVVITRLGDPARVSAVTLAAGRGQLLRFVKSWGDPNDEWSEIQTERRMSEAESLVSNANNSISAITVCMNMSPLANFKGSKENPVATTDLIGRDAKGKRFAWCGWIFGSKKQSAYIASCSLFLPRDQYWFCNTYPNKGLWANYGEGNMEEVLPKFGLGFSTTNGTVESLYKVDKGGLATDVIYFTSKGNQDFLELSDKKIAPTWIPILNTPAALNFIHSWSLKSPSNRTTVGGTWLDRGVYAFVGSSREPLLQAFVPPMEVMRRTMNLVPFLPASRWFSEQGQYAKPWRINTIGDPLMLCGPKAITNRARVEANVRLDCQNVLVEAELVMKQAIADPSDSSFANAINIVTLIGRDQIASKLWLGAIEQSVTGPLSAKAAISSLFRMKAVVAFLYAYQMLEKPSGLEKDYLWQLAGILPETPVELLAENIRTVYSCDDLRIIAPRLAKTRGKSTVLSIINKYLPKARGRNERELKRLLKDYGG